MSPDPQEHGEMADLEPLPDLPQEVPAAAVPPPPAGASGGSSTPRGQKPVPSAASIAARSQEKAPQLLKKAAIVLVAGSFLPWMASLTGNEWLIVIGLKLVLFAGCWLVLQGVLARHGAPTQVQFARNPLAPGKKGLAGTITGLHLIGTVLILASFILGLALISKPLVLGELVTLLLGGLTYAHIVGYEKGGRFSPLYPLMFLGCAVGGLASLVGRIQKEEYLAALGCAVITAAGILAVYTIAVSMMQAKKEGDVKKAAALEARKSARATGREAR